MKFRALHLIFLTMFLSPAVAQQAPVIVNSQTGAQVELVRAYWHPNADIANRVMQCDFYAFNEESQVYEEQATFAGGVPTRPWFRSSPYFHQPLLSLAAPVNDATIGTEPGIDEHGTFFYKNLRLWSVTDGVYAGIAPLMASEYVEIVAHQSDTKNAVRVWHTAESVAYINSRELNSLLAEHAAFHVCYDPDGTPMVPTGQAGVSPQLEEPVDDLIVTLDGLADNNSDAPVLIDLETGLTIEFTTGRWNYNQDIALRQIWCASYRWDDVANQYRVETWPDSNKARWYHPYNGGDSVLVSSIGDDSIFGSTVAASIEDGSLRWPFGRSNLELLNNDSELNIRVWGDNNNSFSGCRVSMVSSARIRDRLTTDPIVLLESTATEFRPSLPLEVIDTSDNNSEAPVAADECDYTNAQEYDGWGWNPVTMSSCPPPTDSDSSVEGTDGMEGSDATQTNPDGIDASSGDTSASDSQSDSDTSGTSAGDQESSTDTGLTENGNNVATTTPSSGGGGGTIWLPLLLVAIAFRQLSSRARVYRSRQ